MRIERFDDGIAICGDATSSEVIEAIKIELSNTDLSLILCDPPYGNIVKDEKWDRIDEDDNVFSDWMVSWTKQYAELLVPGGSFYVWGGIGTIGFRPFFKYLTKIEVPGKFELSTLITWAKKRAYGIKWGYLFTREELAYFVKGEHKKPRLFNIPLLDTIRGYAGYDPKYPAKSEFYRRTNVWSDITEIMQGKLHPTQKKQRVIEIPIEVHTNLGEYVLDQFAGAGTTAFACRKLGRKFIVIEKDETYFDDMVRRLRAPLELHITAPRKKLFSLFSSEETSDE